MAGLTVFLQSLSFLNVERRWPSVRAGDSTPPTRARFHGEMTTIDAAELLIVGAIDDYLPGY
jgi:hypothetical protein